MLFLPMLFTCCAFAQPVLLSDEGIRQVRLEQPPMLLPRANVPDTLMISANNPFFDDFSGEDPLPDTSRWFIPEADFRVPRVVQNSALRLPTPGVLRFDGLRRSGIPYETLVPAAGPADRLVSHILDLSALGPADNFWLYLYVEAGGLCDKPEPNDTFRVNLITPSDTFVLAKLSGSLPGGSTWLSIPLDQAPYFSPLTQLVLEANGSLNGLIDVWLVDYLFLGPELPGGVSSLDEQGPLRLVTSPIEPYFSLPRKIYTGAMNEHVSYGVDVKQNAQGAFSGTLHAEMVQENTTPVSPFFAEVSVSLPGNGISPITIPAFAQQSPPEPGTWQLRHYLVNHSDRFEGNDTLVVPIGIDSLIAYDDGEADASLGLNKNLGLGLRYDLPRKDTVTAVWMYFTPSLHINGVNGKVTYLENKVFRLRLWDFPHPDSFFLEQVLNMNVTYGPEGEFVRLALASPTEVPQRFWLGFQQLDDIPIGVGFDKSYDRDAYTYWDSIGNWVNTRLGGVPMIRVELQTGGPNLANLDDRDHTQGGRPRLLQNPISIGANATITWAAPLQHYVGSLLDLQGRVVHRVKERGVTPPYSYELPGDLTPGLYVWQHKWEINGQPQVFVERLLIQP